MPTTAPPKRKAPEQPLLENFYNVRDASVRLGLADKDDPQDTGGQDWLRRGANRPDDGSKGEKFPSIYMAGQLMFSDSHLAAIVGIAANEPRARTRRTAARRPRKTLATATP